MLKILNATRTHWYIALSKLCCGIVSPMQIQTYTTEAEEREKSEFKTIDLKRSMTCNILCGLNTNSHSKPRINNKLEVQTELCSLTLKKKNDC